MKSPTVPPTPRSHTAGRLEEPLSGPVDQEGRHKALHEKVVENVGCESPDLVSSAGEGGHPVAHIDVLVYHASGVEDVPQREAKHLIQGPGFRV